MSNYRKNCMRWYIKGLRRAMAFAPDTETDGGATMEDIVEEIKRVEEKYNLKPILEETKQ